MIKFSVAIAVYNKEKYIANTLQSVLNQTYPHFEVVVVNDGSTDTSEKEILGFTDQRIKYYKQENQGAGAARNKAIFLAQNNYIALLDADDIWDKNYLNQQLTLIKKFPNHKVFATAIRIEDQFATRASSYTFKNPNNATYLSLSYFESSLKNTILTSSSTVLHKSVFQNIGYYDPTIKSGQDTDLWIRIGLNYSVAFSTTPSATYTYEIKSLSNSIQSTKDRPDFEKFTEEEKTNPALKEFLDNNRLSQAIRAILWKEPEQFAFFKSRIDPKNLNTKQRFLLKQSYLSIKLLFGLKKVLERLGIRLGVFG